MDFSKSTSETPGDTKDELLKKVENLKTAIVDKVSSKDAGSNTNTHASTSLESQPETETDATDQFVQSHKLDSATRGKAGPDSATEARDTASDENEEGVA